MDFNLYHANHGRNAHDISNHRFPALPTPFGVHHQGFLMKPISTDSQWISIIIESLWRSIITNFQWISIIKDSWWISIIKKSLWTPSLRNLYGYPSLSNFNGYPSLSIFDGDPSLRILDGNPTLRIFDGIRSFSSRPGLCPLFSLSLRVSGTDSSASPSHNSNVVIFVMYLYVFDSLMIAYDGDLCMYHVHVFSVSAVILCP